MTDHILVSTADRITTITIQREDKKNAITQAMYGAMADAIETYGNTDDARALVITATGDMFTAGNDLQDFSTNSGPTDGELPPVGRFLNAIRDCPKPLIAAVNGAAIGVGLTMLLHCDLVYAGQSASFSAPFIKLALVPEAASSILLPASVGMAVANDILLAGRILNANEAHDYGLVARVFDDAALQQEVRQIAHTVASYSPVAMRRSKTLIRNQQDRIANHMGTEITAFVEQLKSPDFAESVAAMMQKRAPNYG